MKKRNVILRGAVAVALLIFVGLVLAEGEEPDPIEVMITPQHMSLSKGEVRFVRCYVNAAELAGLEGEYVIYTLGVVGCLAPVESLQKLQHLDYDDDIKTIWFDLPEVRDMLDGKTGEVELTLNITLEDGTVLLYGSDMIVVVD